MADHQAPPSLGFSRQHQGSPLLLPPSVVGASQVALVVKNPPTKRHGVPKSGRPPGGGHGSPLQYSCLENPMDRGAWWATVHRVAESDTTEATEHARTLSIHYINAFVSIKHYTMTKTKYLFECYGLSFCTGKWPNHLLGQDVGEDATFTLENIF